MILHRSDILSFLIEKQSSILVAGTHGNEINAPWIFDQWNKHPNLINTNGLKINRVIGNPVARKKCKRFKF